MRLNDNADAGTTLSALRERWAFASAATLLYWLAHQALRPFVAVRLDELGATAAQVGVAVAVHSIVAFALAIPMGGLGDRFGLRRLVFGSLVIMAVSGAMYPLATTAAHVAVLEGLNGVGTLGVWISLQSLVSHAGSGDYLRRHLALFSVAWGIGLAAGPTVGGLLYDHLGFATLCVAYAASTVITFAAVAAVPLDTSRLQVESDAPTSFSSKMRTILKRGPVQGVLLSSFVMLYVQHIRQSFYPLYLERQGISVSQIGVLLTIIGVASLVVRTVTVPVTRRLGARTVLMASSVLAIVGMAATPWLVTLPMLVIGACLVGAGQGLNAPVTVELMAMHTLASERGMGMGLRAMSNRLAGVVQPLVFGGLGSLLGLAAGFSISGLALLGLTAGVWRASGSLRRPPSVSQGADDRPRP